MHTQPFENSPLIVSRPKLTWKLYILGTQLLFLIVLAHFIHMLSFSLEAQKYIKLVFVFAVLSYLGSATVFLLTYPPSIYIYQSGLSVKHWKKEISVEWEDIDFLKTKSFLFVKTIGLGSRKFPNHRRIMGFFQYFRFTPTYVISNTVYSDFKEVSAILTTNLSDRHTSLLW